MNIRLALYELARIHRLPSARMHALFALAELDAQPTQLPQRFWRVVALLAAGLGGFGIAMWVAANWGSLGRAGQFALLQGWVLLTALAAWRSATLRTPMGLLCLLGTGALFAYYGQTYQTGADAWQLFALWAVLSLPLCLGVRSDVLWFPWATVACSAIGLWTYAHTGHRWRFDDSDLPIHLVGWGMGVLLITVLSPWARHWVGETHWSQRLAMLALAVNVTLTSLAGLLWRSEVSPHYFMGLALMCGAGGMLMQRQWFDIVGLSAAVLCVDTLLVAGLARILFDGGGIDTMGRLLLIGLVAAGLLAVSVAVVMRRQSTVLAASRQQGATA
ncbi:MULTISPECIES: DUF2157 domain-containing protein [unclassified Variovorax]|uniref:DUF2157 domain-containing protein n=1 Tax=unclassified Variovorax TaxID=663243 RepID=UPI000D11896A|nr:MULTISPECIES: DUF2157 domain-containing protein [unclassified Variovorax]AVQ79923.1 DUF2157 domain-containing protein [Variovorax sp. PMC12]QRY30735.1 DUF2157 domain-containing protein [Variovorax sp. PDNC026]